MIRVLSHNEHRLNGYGDCGKCREQWPCEYITLLEQKMDLEEEVEYLRAQRAEERAS